MKGNFNKAERVNAGCSPLVSRRTTRSRCASLWGSLIFVCASLAACTAQNGAQMDALPKTLDASTGALACDGGAPAATDGPIRSAYAPGQIGCLCKASIAKAKSGYDAIAALLPAQRTFANTVLAYEFVGAEFSDETNPLTFMQQVSPDEKTHDEALVCLQELEEFGIATGGRRDLYDAMKGQDPAADPSGQLSQEDILARKRLFTETIRGLEQSGLKLPDAELKEYLALQQKMTEKQTRYGDNLAKDHPTVAIAASAVSGLSTDFLGKLKRATNGDYLIPVDEPDYVEVSQKASDSETRRKVQLAFNNLGGPKNLALLNETVALRTEAARRLGYANYADAAIDGRMAKDGKTVTAFLNDLRAKLQPRIKAELTDLLAYKKKLDPTATELFPWDFGYLSYQIKKNELKVDGDAVREYFPLDLVSQGIFDVYSKLLSVRFKQVVGATAWAPNVSLYEIHEARPGRNGEADDALIGYFYADLAPRPLKYNHAAAFSLISGRRLPNGKYNLPTSSIVANLTAAGAGKPSLLTHGEVETFFHEFGHIMHQTLTRAPYASLSGSSVARDFVEAPSQMLENWVWQPEILNQLSGHWKDHAKKLPTELLEQLLKARDFGRGTFYAKQTLLARFDMALHTLPSSAPVDAQALYDGMFLETVGIAPLKGNMFPANFGHMMGGYAAGYYGYLWSDVYASDMFTQFEGGKTLDPVVGGRYRSEILERGNMQDAGVLLLNFLEREPNNQAFLRKLGIGA